MGEVGNAIDKLVFEVGDTLSGGGKKRDAAYQAGQLKKAQDQEAEAKAALELQDTKSENAKVRATERSRQQKLARKRSGRGGTILTSTDNLGSTPAEDAPLNTVLGG